MSVTVRPWWLFMIQPGCWVTLSPNIYYPKGTDPARYPNVIAHETIHLPGAYLRITYDQM